MTGRALAAAVAALLVVAHPTMPYSLVAWVTNQMHLVQTLVVLSAFLWWHAVRARTIVWWLPLLVFGAAAFMVKEDGLMLLPAIVALHAITRRVSEPDLPAGAVGLCRCRGAARRRAPRLALDRARRARRLRPADGTTPPGST